jgi:hypothetical protein
MDDTADRRFPRLAPILLAIALGAVAAGRLGAFGGEADSAHLLVTTLASFVAVGYVAWRFHGLVAAAAAITLLYVTVPGGPSTGVAERQNDAALLATLAVGIAAGSRQGHSGRLHWWIVAAASVAVTMFGWFGLAMPAAEDAVSRVRAQHVMIATTTGSILVAWLRRPGSRLDRIKLLAVVLLVPAAGVVLARSIRGEWPAFLQASGDWPDVFGEWRMAISTVDGLNGAWAWTLPWVALALVLTGLWRTVVRGRQDWKHGRAPLTWLLAVASVGGFFAVAARPIASGSLALAALAALLSVFGVADLIQAMVERIALKPPEPGIADIPRVK